MSDKWSRRQLLSGLGAGVMAASSGTAWAQAAGSGQGLLARLQAAKKVTVGLVNQLPGSILNPDGTLDGLAPTFAKLIMGRLGVPEVQGIAATYGELIPGLQAGRWDFIAAALSITKARCAQVLYSDPLMFDGGTFVSLKGALPRPPKLVADLVAQNLIVGVSTGGAHARVALEAGVNPANLRQFPADVAIIDGLLAKRIQVAFGSSSTLGIAYRQRNLDVDVTFPIADDPSNGQACAFRLGDQDLNAAFQKELRAMKASGEYLPIAQKFGFDTPPELMFVTSDQLCTTGP
jgi:polar amino acid transport system substrate-binding protein